MSGHTWPDDVTVRDWRWLPVLVLAILASGATGLLVFDATSKGEDATGAVVAFLVCAGIAVAANVGLRVRLLGDRAGIRLKKRFIPWFEVVAIQSGEGGHGGTLELTGDRTVSLPNATDARDRDGIQALREDAGRFGVGRLPDPPVSLLRSLPMDREVLPSGAARGVGSVSIALLVLAALLWPMLPSTGVGTAIPPTRHFPDDALRPIWTKYLLPPGQGAGSVEFAARQEGVAIPLGVPFEALPTRRWLRDTYLTQFMPSGRKAWEVPLATHTVTVDQFGKVRIIDITADWQVVVGQAGLAMIGRQNWGQSSAAPVPIPSPGYAEAVPVDTPRRDRRGTNQCCRLRLLDSDGKVAWNRNLDIERPRLIAAGRSFLLIRQDPVPPARCPTRCDEHHLQMTTVSATGRLREAGSADVAGRQGSYSWLHGELLVVAGSRGVELTSHLTSIRLGGEISWETSITGDLSDIVATRTGYVAILTQQNPARWYEPPQRWVIGLDRDGAELWRRELPEDERILRLFTDGPRTYMLQQRLSGSGPVTTLHQIDAATGAAKDQWEIATVRVGPQFSVTDGAAYLYSSNTPYSLQRYEWPPEAAGNTP